MKSTLFCKDGKNYIVAFLLVSSLFFMWGVANNMTDTLLSAFKRIMSMSDFQTSLIQFAFYGAYFCFALPTALLIRRYSYKTGIILGLLLYALGTMLFYPAGQMNSYAFYLFAIYLYSIICFTVARFIFTALMKYFQPSKLLAFSAACAIVATSSVICNSGMLAIVSLIAVSFFMSLMFPTIYGIALDNVGKDMKIGASGLIMAILGGAVLTPVQGFVSV
jgi:fucose permease